MADAGPSSGHKCFMDPQPLHGHSLSPIPGLPFIGPHTSNLLSPMFASSAPTQPGAIVDIWRSDGISGYPPLKYEALRLVVLQGIDITKSNHFSDLWAHTVQGVIRGIVLNMHLPVAQSAGGFLQPGIYAATVFSRLTLTPHSYPVTRLDQDSGGGGNHIYSHSRGCRPRNWTHIHCNCW